MHAVLSMTETGMRRLTFSRPGVAFSQEKPYAVVAYEATSTQAAAIS